MADFVKVAQVSDVPVGGCRSAEAAGTPVALFNVGGRIHATQDLCLHMEGPLGEGDLDGSVVTCPWHAWQYDVTTGQCLTSPECALRTFEVKVEGDDVFLMV